MTGTLIAIALRDGLLDSLDRRVLEFFPGRTIANLDDNKQAMTIRHLLNMTSGLEWKERLDDSVPETFLAMEQSADWQQFILDQPMAQPPGTAFEYNSGNSHLLSAIINRLTGERALVYAREQLFGPLGIADVFWRRDPQGISTGGAGLYLQPRDMAKIGYLYLRNGMWEGRQIVPPAWIDAVNHASVDMRLPGLRYANQFWVLPDKHVYAAVGFHRQLIVVMPDLDIVAVATGTRNYPSARLIDGITGAVKSNQPLPENAAARSALDLSIADAATERPSPVGPVPETAKQVSGKVYAFAPNALNLRTLALNLNGANPSFEFVSSPSIPQRQTMAIADRSASTAPIASAGAPDLASMPPREAGRTKRPSCSTCRRWVMTMRENLRSPSKARMSICSSRTSSGGKSRSRARPNRSPKTNRDSVESGLAFLLRAAGVSRHFHSSPP